MGGVSQLKPFQVQVSETFFFVENLLPPLLDFGMGLLFWCLRVGRTWSSYDNRLPGRRVHTFGQSPLGMYRTTPCDIVSSFLKRSLFGMTLTRVALDNARGEQLSSWIHSGASDVASCLPPNISCLCWHDRRPCSKSIICSIKALSF